MRLTVDVEATDGPARRGTVRTARGSFSTPAFMPVGTRGSIRALSTHELASVRASDGSAPEILLANTYHLMLRPGADVVEDLGGLHRFSGWDGLHLTDSGGYQVFSLEPKVTDEGARFRSTYDGDTNCSPRKGRSPSRSRSARTSRWCSTCAPNSRRRPRRPAGGGRPNRALGGAGQARPTAAARTRRCSGSCRAATTSDLRERIGGTDLGPRLRRVRDRRPVGGGDPGRDAARARAAALAGLPSDQPRYLMGVGDPVSVDRVGRPRGRHVRLRAADAAGPPRHPAHRCRTAEHQAGGVRPQRGSGRAELPLSRPAGTTRGLPAPPEQRGREAGGDAVHHPQPHVDPGLGRPGALGDRRGPSGATSAVTSPRRTARHPDDPRIRGTDRLSGPRPGSP